MASVVAISLVGPPAAGKSSLVNSLRSLNCLVFRLREYAPVEALAATASTATGLGWISNDITASCLRSFVEHALTVRKIRSMIHEYQRAHRFVLDLMFAVNAVISSSSELGICQNYSTPDCADIASIRGN